MCTELKEKYRCTLRSATLRCALLRSAARRCAPLRSAALCSAPLRAVALRLDLGRNYCGRTHPCTIWLKITPKLHQNCAEKHDTPAGQFCAPPVSRFAAQFWRNFQPHRAKVCPSTVVFLKRCSVIITFLLCLLSNQHQQQKHVFG